MNINCKRFVLLPIIKLPPVGDVLKKDQGIFDHLLGYGT